MRRVLYPCLLVLAAASAFSQAKFGNEKAITPERLRAHLELVASDEMGGRDTPSLGLDITALYLSTQLKLWGATPGGDNGGFLQKIKLVRGQIDFDKSSATFGGKTYAYGDGFKAASTGGQVSGKLVYVGHGYMVAKKGIDPYKGVDLKGKIMVVANGRPKDVSFQDLQGTSGTDFLTPGQAATKYGAVGILTIPDTGYLASWQPRTPGRLGGFSLEGGGGGGRGGFGATVPSMTASLELVQAVMSGEKASPDDVMRGADAPETAFEFASDKTLSINVVQQQEVQWTENVVAIVPGTDPNLKSEYVAFGAHMDHVGTRATGDGDRIYNGADDDGSGTVSILEIAHAFLTGPRPKRSLIFVWHCGEEKGLWGSSYFTDHPTVDITKIVTQLNIDMIGRSKKDGDTDPRNKVLTGPNEVYVVGSTKMSTDLQKTSESVNKAFLNLAFNYKYDDPKDTERIFYRSDHYNYARKGIPIIFYFDGVHEDYHQPGDEVQKIDFLKMSKIAQTVYATGWTIANAAKRPVVDKPLGN